jgi:hypothetical protein
MKTHSFVLLKCLIVIALVVIGLNTPSPASANVNTLIVGRRTCETATAYVLYDGFSAGHPVYLAAFTVDLDGDGVYGEAEAGERTIFTNLGAGSSPSGYVKGVLKFSAVPEGTKISISAYEVDSNGRTVSRQLPAVSYTCTNRPQTKQIPADVPFVIPAVAVTARVTAETLSIYDSPKGTESKIVGGLAQGAIVTAIGRNSRGDWLQIAFGSGTAWIMWNTNAIVFGPYKSLPVTAQ